MRPSNQLDHMRDGVTIVVGLGAIGSWVARYLSAHGISWIGFDDDTVSLKNVDAGAFSPSDVGTLKVRALGLTVQPARWTPSDALGRALIVCADDGGTRRAAARAAHRFAVPMYCGKANGADHQVWTVRDAVELESFLAFDAAADADPVQTPCGAPTVGRVASLKAAAGILATWSGLDITPDEVESTAGVVYDPAVGRVCAQAWERNQAQAVADADAAARKAREDAIDAARTASDAAASAALEDLRKLRRARKRRPLASIHETARASVDGGHPPRASAQIGVGRYVPTRAPLHRLARIERETLARAAASHAYTPDTVEILEVSA